MEANAGKKLENTITLSPWKKTRFSFKPKIRIKWNGNRLGTILIFLSKAISLLHQNLTDKTTEQLPAQLASKVLQLGD